MVDAHGGRSPAKTPKAAGALSVLPLLMAGAVAMAAAAAMIGTFWLIEVLPFATFMGVVILYVLSSSGSQVRIDATVAGEEGAHRGTGR